MFKNNNHSHIRDDPNIHQPGATLRKTEYSPTPWEECNLASAWLDISLTQLSRPIPYRHLIAWSTGGGGYTLLRGGFFFEK